MYEIKKNIPLPATSARGAAPLYPFAQMVSGDCFDAEIRDGETAAQACTRVRNAATTFRSRHKSSLSFTVREAEEKGVAVVRVWATVKNADLFVA